MAFTRLAESFQLLFHSTLRVELGESLFVETTARPVQAQIVTAEEFLVDRRSNIGSGFLVTTIANTAANGRLQLPDRHETYDLSFGSMDPITTVTGLQARLRQLGRYHGEVDGDLSTSWSAAILQYQRANGLPQTGVIDQGFRDAAQRDYGL